MTFGWLWERPCQGSRMDPIAWTRSHGHGPIACIEGSLLVALPSLVRHRGDAVDEHPCLSAGVGTGAFPPHSCLTGRTGERGGCERCERKTGGCERKTGGSMEDLVCTDARMHADRMHADRMHADRMHADRYKKHSMEELGCPDGSVVIRTGLTVALGAGGTCGDALADAEAVNARLEAVNAHAAMRLQMRRVGPPSGAVMGAVMGAVYGRDAAAGSRDRVEIACGHVCGVARCREWRLDRHPTHSRRMPSPRQSQSSAGRGGVVSGARAARLDTRIR